MSIGKEKVNFIVMIDGDSSVGDFGYSCEVTLQNDGRDLEDFIEHSKEVLKDLYGQEYKAIIMTDEELDKMITQEELRYEIDLERR